MVTYICKYTPTELLAAMGLAPEQPNEEVRDFSVSDTLIHSSICSHAKQLLTILCQDCEGRHCCGGPRHVLMTSCCDSIRRVYDTLQSENKSFDSVTILDLPHQSGPKAAGLYACELKRLVKLYGGAENGAGEKELWKDRLIEGWKEASAAWQVFLRIGEPFYVLLGARPGTALMARLEKSLSKRIVNLSCGGLRSLPPPPEDAGAMDGDALLCAYSAALLSQLPCTRMEDTSPRDRLLEQLAQKGLAGIIYHTVRFCDYYSFEYAAIRRRTKLPMLKLESDYTDQSGGQISTRIAAFKEELAARGPAARTGSGSGSSGAQTGSRAGSSGTQTGSRAGSPDAPAGSGSLFAAVGIDSGSTTTNAVAVNQDGRILASTTVRTGARACDAAQRALDQIRSQLGDEAALIRRILATGYGREYISFADETRTEISCHAEGAHFLHPEIRTIIDIGGQDSKVICLDEAGGVSNFIMNDKCAAGTGRFLEMMAHTLEMDLSRMAGLGLKWEKDLDISSVCTVFAESEVVSLIARNHELDDIIHALNKAVASKTCSMVRRARGAGPFIMTGGVARNTGVAREIERLLGARLAVDPQPDLAGALGAALLAVKAVSGS